MIEGIARLRDSDPQRLGPFRLHGVLGSGAAGTVYLGKGTPWRGARKRTVAVRAVRPELLRDRQLRARVRQETGHAAASVDSPHVAEALGCELDSEQPWIATAFVPGHSVAALVASYGPLPEMSVRALGGGVSRALAALHATGTPHRDLRAGNVLLSAAGPRVVDYGTPLGRSAAVGGRNGNGEQEASTAGHLADDVFELGVLLVLAATARSPFTRSLLPTAREDPDLAGVPEALRPTLLDCLHKTPASRPRPEPLARALDLSGMAERPAEEWLPEPYVHDIDGRAEEARRLVGRLFRR
ncbi:protein kinase domain-containing protein [Streptomyces iconiensis]|uniref:Protein kinase n=1 Tax=Streptomyces iconiensis TaxID=1384038 RepID=A0ABT7A1P2_9ACTN|nr:protein kinase [Streptomyces iconiensis]MDJ1135231.1 protein kinase [Streptomyces iconiensis]